jgi:hypothetical protein
MAAIGWFVGMDAPVSDWTRIGNYNIYTHVRMVSMIDVYYIYISKNTFVKIHISGVGDRTARRTLIFKFMTDLDEEKLPLPKFLNELTRNGVPVAKAIAVASKT